MKRFKGIARNNYMNGKWNILTVFYTKQFSSLSIRHFIPLLFLLFLFLPVLLSFFYSPLIVITFLSLISYTLCAFIVCLFFKYKEETQSLLFTYSISCITFILWMGIFCGAYGIEENKIN